MGVKTFGSAHEDNLGVVVVAEDPVFADLDVNLSAGLSLEVEPAHRGFLAFHRIEEHAHAFRRGLAGVTPVKLNLDGRCVRVMIAQFLVVAGAQGGGQHAHQHIQ